MATLSRHNNPYYLHIVLTKTEFFCCTWEYLAKTPFRSMFAGITGTRKMSRSAYLKRTVPKEKCKCNSCVNGVGDSRENARRLELPKTSTQTPSEFGNPIFECHCCREKAIRTAYVVIKNRTQLASTTHILGRA